jgi:hypothetical protein
MKRSKSNGFNDWGLFARWKRDQVIKRTKADDPRYQFGMRVLLLILSVACAAVGWVLLTILMR